MTFAEKLKQVRIGCRLTQEQIAEIIGVTRKTIILYEAGDRTPKQEKVYESLANHFQTSVDFWKYDVDSAHIVMKEMVENRVLELVENNLYAKGISLFIR